MSISQDIPVEGEITIPMRSRIREFDSSTLNESMRDLKAVGKKFLHVLYPRKSNTLLRDWDLWGPLVLCVTRALMLQRGSADHENDAEVFVITWFGAVTITLNSKLLGGNIPFFQSLCVLVYTSLDSGIAGLPAGTFGQARTNKLHSPAFVVIVMFAWSIVASKLFLLTASLQTAKPLPFILFSYSILSSVG
ncbi:LOW QUALITY PROTEIN: hypothetical protein QTO34_001614 [Cnephaeus nilssonii]|uniref:Protein YIPF n=1 Tax=Cnephaeus nilssonii TaxID=3371016 RepID=A0AA40HWA8_CNENI|nr:LOW QUALITY PROTEIN: hypothetical protein QTO34_001614 [Eptesicus nilssonii]